MKRVGLIIGLWIISMSTFAQSISQELVQVQVSGGNLQGSLLIPQSNHPVPVVLMIAGSGPTDRNGNGPSSRNDALKRLAQALAQRGIASLRYDKRGVAKSLDVAPEESQLNVPDFVEDVRSWSQLLANDSRLGPQVILGHSEGALIGSLAAPTTKAVGLITLAGSGRPIQDVLLEQLATRQPASLFQRSQSIIEALSEGQRVNAIPPALDVLFRPSVQPYLISLFQYDPARALQRVPLPVLIIQGTADIQVNLQDAQRLKAAKPEAHVRIIEGMNHVLRIAPLDFAAQQATYHDPKLPVARELIDQIEQFVRQAATANPPNR